MTPPPRTPLLARIQETHPEWLEHVAHEAHADRHQGHAFRIRLPSADRRPDVELSFDETEALVRVGLHEQLFGWPPGETEEAVEERKRPSRRWSPTWSGSPDPTSRRSRSAVGSRR